MSFDKIIAYNQKTAKKHGWLPEWFGVNHYGEELILAIKKFQKEHGLVSDGYCGSSTFRKISTVRMAEEDSYLIYKGNKIPIDWDEVILFCQPGGLEANSKNYSSYESKPEQRNPTLFVAHWDVTLSAPACYRILENRGISVHFSIGNRGEIYQYLDLRDVAWHAGSRSHNHASIGVEISCAYDLKWNSWYERKGFGERPIVRDAQVHGKTLSPFLGFYPVQIQALVALVKAIHDGCGIPLKTPNVKNGLDPDVVDGSFSGFCSHYHITERKIDCAGLNLEHIIQSAITLSKES